MDKKSIIFLQINKGNSKFNNRIDQIQNIISQHKPHMMIINELNIKNGDIVSRNQYQNYRMETDNLDIIDQVSRTGILVHQSIHYKRRLDLEAKGLSTIWLQLNYPGRRPILIQGIYRQFRRLGRAGSNSITSQTERWRLILEKWEQADKEGMEIITVGVININIIDWDKPTNQMDPYEKVKAPMAKMFREKILQKGFKILNKKPTRNDDTSGQRPACLDLLITNRADKILSHDTLPAFSNHTLQILIRRTSEMKSQPQVIKTRSYKNYSNYDYKMGILNHGLYIETLYEKDPDVITENLQKIVGESLDSQAPIINVKTTKKKLKKIIQRS